MPNLTMTLDEGLLRRARKVALENGASLTALIRRYLVTSAQVVENGQGGCGPCSVDTGRPPCRVSFWDGLILSAARRAGCKTLFSEDFSHGQIFQGLKIVNPFLEN